MESALAAPAALAALALRAWLVWSVQLVAPGYAEVTCSSCPWPARVGSADAVQQLDQGFGPAVTLGKSGNRARAEFRPTALVLESAGERERNSKVAEKTRGEVLLGDQPTSRRKRSGPGPDTAAQLTGSRDSNLGDPETPSDERARSHGLLLDGHRASSDGRWSRDDGRASGSRLDDAKLTSSTFALAGDSAHNHAVVYWTGQNSSEVLLHRLSKRGRLKLKSIDHSGHWALPQGLFYKMLLDSC
ncbi:hypothetical protein AOLI_G00238950 [Acnodon oligacanthus]